MTKRKALAKAMVVALVAGAANLVAATAPAAAAAAAVSPALTGSSVAIAPNADGRLQFFGTNNQDLVYQEPARPGRCPG